MDEKIPPKKPRSSSECLEEVAEPPLDPIAHWAVTGHWPETFKEEGFRMSQPHSSKRKSAVHHSTRRENLSKHGIFKQNSNSLQKSSKDLCLGFLKGDLTPSRYPCYPPEQVPNILYRIQFLNEARLQRDVTPWVVPSAENLYFSGEITLEYIGDEINAEWIRCATMGSSKPKPDYTAGLLRNAFTLEELEKLENYASFEKPFQFTHNLCFPFLICEAKTGQEGLQKADQQNIHSASIAVRAIIELYKAAYGTNQPDRVDKLFGQVLVFSVSHNNDLACLYGHYAIPSNKISSGLEFYRFGIDVISLSAGDGAFRHKPYNFVLNIYEKFASKHRERIKEAVSFLQVSAPRTGQDFADSDLAMEEMVSYKDSQNAASQDDRVFKKPNAPSSVADRREIAKMQAQMSKLLQQMQESKEREAKMGKQMEQMKQQILGSSSRSS